MAPDGSAEGLTDNFLNVFIDFKDYLQIIQKYDPQIILTIALSNVHYLYDFIHQVGVPRQGPAWRVHIAALLQETRLTLLSPWLLVDQLKIPCIILTIALTNVHPLYDIHQVGVQRQGPASRVIIIIMKHFYIAHNT